MKNILKYIGIILSAILPTAGVIYFTGIYDFNLYDLLWCGFYGCIIICMMCPTIYKAVAIISNSAILLLCTFGALMGGMSGLKLIILHMMIPFYSILQTVMA